MAEQQQEQDLCTLRLSRCGPTGPIEVTDRLVEVAWAPVVGPTIVLLLRSLDTTMLTLGEDVAVTLDDLAATIGVAPTRALRAVNRAHRKGLIVRHGQQLGLPTHVALPRAESIRELPTMVQQVVAAASARSY